MAAAASHRRDRVAALDDRQLRRADRRRPALLRPAGRPTCGRPSTAARSAWPAGPSSRRRSTTRPRCGRCCPQDNSTELVSLMHELTTNGAAAAAAGQPVHAALRRRPRRIACRRGRCPRHGLHAAAGRIGVAQAAPRPGRVGGSRVRRGHHRTDSRLDDVRSDPPLHRAVQVGRRRNQRQRPGYCALVTLSGDTRRQPAGRQPAADRRRAHLSAHPCGRLPREDRRDAGRRPATDRLPRRHRPQQRPARRPRPPGLSRRSTTCRCGSPARQSPT